MITKATKFSVLAITMIALQAQAIFDPNWERPIESAAMEIIETRNGFELVDNLEVVLRKRDGSVNLTSIVLNYEQGMGDMLPAFENISETFEIDANQGIEKDDCGSVYYSASKGDTAHGRAQGARTHMTLIDHRHRVCDDLVPNVFEIHFRKGYGWCGTMDSVLHATGKPEPLMSAYIK